MLAPEANSHLERNMPSSLVDLSTDFANTVERVGNSVIAIPEGGRVGVSGTIWREGIAIAADHTVHGLDEVTVILPDGREVKAAVAGRDYGTDIAALKLPEPVQGATIVDVSQIRPGEIVLTVGRRGTDGVAVAHGLVGAVGGPWRTFAGGRVDRWISLDLNPFPGFSGGPVINAAGEVLGMAISGRRRSAVVITATTVNRVVDQLLQHGRTARGYIGVALQPVAFPEGSSKSLGISVDRGLLVTSVAPDSAAAESQLKFGDVIVRIEGSPIGSARDLQWVLDGESVGKSIALEVIRGGQLLKISVVVREKQDR
jgi:S1-C subfamily serine protease